MNHKHKPCTHEETERWRTGREYYGSYYVAPYNDYQYWERCTYCGKTWEIFPDSLQEAIKIEREML